MTTIGGIRSVQRCLLRAVVDRLRVHDSAHAYRPGRDHGIRANAAAHCTASFLLRMDFRSFFDSISKADVALLLNEQGPSIMPDWSEADSAIFSELVCFQGHLVMGAPTSPGVSNAICFRLDTELAEMAYRRGVTYTRYCDDMFFSTSRRDVLCLMEHDVALALTKLPFLTGLKINPAKTRHSSMRGRRTVTGFVLTSDRTLSVGRAMKRRIRSQVHKWTDLGADEQLKVRGTLAYLSDVDPDFINTLILKYGGARVRAISGPA